MIPGRDTPAAAFESGEARLVDSGAVEPIVVWHFTDPGCPWAYSARPRHARLRWRFGDQLEWRLVLIGLSEDAQRYTDRGYTPVRMALGHRRFRDRFGMPFALAPKPRPGATSRACRAIVAARALGPAQAEDALLALQLLQFTTAGLLDVDEDLRRALAAVPTLDAEAIVAQIDDPTVIEAYEADRARARSAAGSPTAAQGRTATSDGPVRYTAPSLVFEHPDGRTLEAGGFQPFEAYDLALANLDPGLARRPPPEDALSVLAELPEGLSTAEVAAVLRPSDLADDDRTAAEEALVALAAEGAVIREPVGQDALWRPVPPAAREADLTLAAGAAAH